MRSSMDDLPYIDEHTVRTDASPARVWSALVDFLATSSSGATPLFARAVGCDPAHGSREFAGRLDDTIPGFRVVESEPGRRLALAGRHWFARYQLIFVIDPDGQLAAQSYGEFPGLRGRAYRAAVVGTGGHRTITRGMLRKIASRAKQ